MIDIIKKYWGYDSYLPLQQEAMQCVLDGRDSIVVLPTGGGKSLCFQAPALAMDGMAIVVSPLISLMKDQVDALKSNGITAASLNSAMLYTEKRDVDRLIQRSQLKLLYVSPERLVNDVFIEYLNSIKISFIAIDEGHCISIWGHDFRPEYRMLGMLKEKFPNIALHTYTATATKQVQNDIASQINLDNPEILVGSYDRPNLIYRVKRADKRFDQICTVIDRHPNESGLIYCIRRADVDEISHRLKVSGYDVLPYHAGMDPEDRRRNQEAFIQEHTDIIVATVAFGMGIDKSNVRYVIHSGMPKSLEHYQQEIGRAGRDGLAADCLLIYSGRDLVIWKLVLSDLEGEAGKIAMEKLYEMSAYCSGVECRHKALVNYFGQDYDKSNCDACDICLDDIKLAEDALIIGQKILSCIIRLNEGFGADYIAKVLAGSRDKRILNMRHDRVRTYGILKDFVHKQIRDWIDQLTSQGYIDRDDEFRTLKVTSSGWRVIRGEETPKLTKAVEYKERDKKVSKVEIDSWEDVDRELYDRLRELRSELAGKKNVPAYIIFGDASLRDMARKKPKDEVAFLGVYGVGRHKAREYADVFIKVMVSYS
ncbi:MAG: DNA helicase RecQ [Candidatus Hatepunaea meridiana]|nr:DNA helicase RecQ [Candidatus Hatepunaea meridiana]